MVVEAMRSGVVLCQLVNSITPDTLDERVRDRAERTRPPSTHSSWAICGAPRSLTYLVPSLCGPHANFSLACVR